MIAYMIRKHRGWYWVWTIFRRIQSFNRIEFEDDLCASFDCCKWSEFGMIFSMISFCDRVDSIKDGCILDKHCQWSKRWIISRMTLFLNRIDLYKELCIFQSTGDSVKCKLFSKWLHSSIEITVNWTYSLRLHWKSSRKCMPLKITLFNN